ncbi:MAG TPA: phosphoribosylglycinamide formyltransferase [Gemmatimonadaceae bacterium]|nr:phosphoribosylglycinamide formyltransferase [Gemmatimonadaceae bacterium]
MNSLSYRPWALLSTLFSRSEPGALTALVAEPYNPRVPLQSASRARVAVLASGGGSNLQAIVDYFAALGPHRCGDVVLVASDRINAPALNRARNAGIEAVHLDGELRGDGMLEALVSRGVMIVVLAGYLQLVPSAVTTAYRGRIVNVHPALLPAFGGRGMYGERVHAAVLAAGVAISGATVHFVDEVYDRGAIVAQWPVPVSPNDTVNTLGPRVLAVEHLLYPRVVNALCSGRIHLDAGGKVAGVPAPESAAAFSMGDYVGLRHSLDRWLG